jgi:hypothetical protein
VASVSRHPLSAYEEMAPTLGKIILSSAEIGQKVWQIGEAVSQDYAGRDPGGDHEQDREHG